MVCPKCGSTNVIIQREQKGNIGFSHGHIGTKIHHGLLYWLFFGWWLTPLKLLVTLPFKLLPHRHKGVQNNSVYGSKVFNETVAVCQDCGHHWKV